MELLQSLTPEQQAILAGAVVSALIALVKRIWPSQSADETVKLKQALSAILLSGFAALPTTTPFEWKRFVLGWFIAWVASQGAYGVGKTAQHVGRVVTGNLAPQVVEVRYTPEEEAVDDEPTD